jgi:hypothetical protein
MTQGANWGAIPESPPFEFVPGMGIAMRPPVVPACRATPATDRVFTVVSVDLESATIRACCPSPKASEPASMAVCRPCCPS